MKTRRTSGPQKNHIKHDISSQSSIKQDINATLLLFSSVLKKSIIFVSLQKNTVKTEIKVLVHTCWMPKHVYFMCMFF